jgi:hypothetical protein
VTFPQVSAEVGFAVGPSVGAYLVLDDPTRGKLGTGQLAPDAVFTDVTAYTRSFATTFGANRVDSPLLRYEPATLTLQLNDFDRRFDPANLSGPYVSGGVTQVTPMRAVRIRATYAGVTYEVYRGFADSWKTVYAGPNHSVVTLSATDGSKVLRSYSRTATAPIGAGEDSGARVNRILDSVSWPDADRLISVGDTTLQATTLEGDALTELQLVQDTEMGELYIDAGGRVVFRNRQAICEDTRSNTVQAIFGDAAGELAATGGELSTDYDEAALANVIRITRVGGAQQEASDALSVQNYLTHTHERGDLLMQTDTVAADYANYVLYHAKDPEQRFDVLKVYPQSDPDNLFPQVLGRKVGDRIRIKRRPPGGGTIDQEVFIRGIGHEVEQEYWVTTWQLQSATTFSFLTLDDPTLGKLDQNALGF